MSMGRAVQTISSGDRQSRVEHRHDFLEQICFSSYGFFGGFSKLSKCNMTGKGDESRGLECRMGTQKDLHGRITPRQTNHSTQHTIPILIKLAQSLAHPRKYKRQIKKYLLCRSSIIEDNWTLTPFED